MHAGRGGWTWYTGSAGWMYQAAVQALLGLQRQGETFSIDPCIPSMWPEYLIEWTVRGTRYRIVVENPEHRSRGIAAAHLDGVAVDASAIPLLTDGAEHEVRVALGATVAGDEPLTSATAKSSGV
jgi:cyclic beta-1,2-glucan synthetase